jgi:hypothetical protein
MAARSLHGHKGGVKSTMRMPCESEAFALTVGTAMLWAKLRNSDNPTFFDLVADEVQRAESTMTKWTAQEMKTLFHNRIFCGIGQKGLKLYMQRLVAGKTETERHNLLEDFIGNVIYRFLATADAGTDAETSLALATKANLDDVLQCKKLGGKPGWRAANFIQQETWDNCGEQSGLAEVAIKFLTMVACKARPVPINPLCVDCGAMRCTHKGDRTNVVMIACECDTEDVSTANAMKRKASPTTVGGKRTRGFTQDLDPMNEGVLETYDRKVKLVAQRYPDMDPKAILTKMLGKDVSVDEDIPSGRASSSHAPGLTGEQGGRIVACYLYSLEKDGTLEDFFEDGDGAAGVLQRLRPATCTPTSGSMSLC